MGSNPHVPLRTKDFESLTPTSVSSSFSAKSARFLEDDDFLCWLSLAAFCSHLFSFTKLQQEFWGKAAATERLWHFAILKITPARTGTMTVRGQLETRNPLDTYLQTRRVPLCREYRLESPSKWRVVAGVTVLQPLL